MFTLYSVRRDFIHDTTLISIIHIIIYMIKMLKPVLNVGKAAAYCPATLYYLPFHSRVCCIYYY